MLSGRLIPCMKLRSIGIVNVENPDFRGVSGIVRGKMPPRHRGRPPVKRFWVNGCRQEEKQSGIGITVILDAFGGPTDEARSIGSLES